MIEYRCPCGCLLVAPESRLGQSVPCPTCGHVNKLPSAPTKKSGWLLASVIVGVVLLCAGVGVELERRISRVWAATARMVEQSHFKGIAVALHNFADAHGELPRADAFRSPDGKPLLSWRVAILPYIEEEALYKQFRLDQPWDSPHNLALLPRIPRMYRRPNEEPDPRGLTQYQVVVGKGLLFDPDLTDRQGKLTGRRLKDVADGTSNTLMLVVAKNPVPWTKPQDVNADDGLPFGPRLDVRWGGRLTLLLADGSVCSKLPDLSEPTWRAVLSADGGEPLPAEWDGK